MSDMRRREFITLLGGAAAWPLAARAQQPGKILRIVILLPYWLLHRDPRIWAQPETFNPMRFVDKSETERFAYS